MNMFEGLLLAGLLYLTTHPVSQQETKLKVWSAATYHGLVVGKSTREDLVRALGEPQLVGRESDTGLPIVTYVVSDPVPGSLVVYIKKGRLDGMTLMPKNKLKKLDVIHLFGPDYIMVRYATDDCLTKSGTAPIYEDSAGDIEHMEYRSRGIAAILHDDDVEEVVFVDKPFGPDHSLCAARGNK